MSQWQLPAPSVCHYHWTSSSAPFAHATLVHVSSRDRNASASRIGSVRISEFFPSGRGLLLRIGQVERQCVALAKQRDDGGARAAHPPPVGAGDQARAAAAEGSAKLREARLCACGLTTGHNTQMSGDDDFDFACL